MKISSINPIFRYKGEKSPMLNVVVPSLQKNLANVYASIEIES